ncbi:hypothetical protein F5Y03DRAFT_407947 [Xylaria venustula]|nr:hypothetical protein F5Y03DRAFT_407947 [Xylaria venustula]
MSSMSSSTGPSTPTSLTGNPSNLNPIGTPPSNEDGFARPPPDFDPEKAKKEFLKNHGKGLLNPNDSADESIEDEIAREIAGLEKMGRVTEEEKTRIAKKIRSIREGGWLEGLKFELVGKDAVPIECFNRLAAEHENTILKVAQINLRAERKVAEKDAEIEILRKKSTSNPEDANALLDNAILHDENNELKDKLAEYEQRGSKLETEMQGLREELQQEKSKPRGNPDTEDALSKCRSQVADLQRQLSSAKSNLETSRKTLSQRYEEVQSLRQQRNEGRGREQALKDDVIKLRTENKELSNTLNQLKTLRQQIVQCETERANSKGEIASLKREIESLRTVNNAPQGLFKDTKTEALRERIIELEANWEKCKDKVKSLQTENQNLKDARKTDFNDQDGLRKEIAKLSARIVERDVTIRALEAQLRDLPSPRQDKDKAEAPSTKLKALCNELREARDEYRSRWARRVIADNPTLRQFWDAVENTNQEIKQLYRAIYELGRALGLPTETLDTSSIIEQITTQVTASVSDKKLTPQLAVLNLLNANTAAQIRIETLTRDLDRAQFGKSEDEIRKELVLVDENELEERVSARTQTYREHRRAILAHIFEAQTEFLALADLSVNRAAIEALVDRYLQPTSLPMAQSAQSGRRN